MKYFTIDELSKSDSATKNNIANNPNTGVITALTLLIDKVLDPLRAKYGRAIIVNSGYRSPELNRFVNKGKDKPSQHMRGEAADITTGSKEGNKRLFEIIKNELPFDQLIDEKDFSWVHVSYKAHNNRKQILKL